MPYAFSTAQGSVFECGLDFDDVHFANINFLDNDRSDIPFHLSFRFRRQVMVHNRRANGKWAKEQPTPVILEKRGNLLRVEFDRRAATILVNGTKVAKIDLPGPLNGASSLTEWVGATGGVGEIRLAGSAHENRRGRGLLSMDTPFRLDGWGFDPASDHQELAIVVRGSSDPLPMVTLSVPEIAREQGAPVQEIGVLGLVPGWVWTRVPEEANATELELLCNGRPCGAPLTIDRASTAAVIEEICARSATADPFELLSAIEHVRFGKLGGRLSQAARSRLDEAARRYKVEDFVNPPKSGPGKAGSKDSSHTGPESDHVAASTVAHGAVQTEQPALPRNPVIDRLKDLAPLISQAAPKDMAQVLTQVGFEDLTENEQRGYLLSVTSGFCAAGRFDDLFAIAERVGLDEMPVGQGDWTAALVLPFCYNRRDAGALLSGMQRVETVDGWIDQTALTWTVRQVVAEAPSFLTEAQREDIVDIFLRTTERAQDQYFGLGPSEDLLRCFVTLLEHLSTLTEDMQNWVVDRALRHFGLSRRFWDLIEQSVKAGRLDAPPAVQDGQSNFARIVAAIEAGDFEAAEAGLPLRSPDVPRFRRELAAAAQCEGLPTREAALLAAGGAPLGGPEADDALVRQLAFPAGGEESPELARVARGALRRLNQNIPRSYHPETQRAATAAVHAILREVPGDPESLSEALDALFRQLRQLGSRRSDYLGQGIAISLISAALLDAEDTLAEEAALRLLGFWGELAEEDAKAATAAPAMRMALYGLRQIQMRRPTDLGRQVLERFTGVLSQLPAPFDEGKASSHLVRAETGIAAFHDVLVVVYSCVPNLETRIPALRKSWLDDLKARGIPYIVVVGDGDGRREGDVVHLDAPDGYEALPKKTIAMADWVLKNTPFAHMFKIDDDCFLDADEAIGGLSYRKHPYFGRTLIRREGETDRIWHHARGSSATACMEIDKSSEPSEYADGGSAYVLNRRAMQSLVEASKSPRGAWLRLVSFMEDKLVGDTLALKGIKVASLDFHVCILRRTHSKGLSVCRWENAFLPSQATPTLLAHLDASDLQPLAAETKTSHQLKPLRVWPTFEPARLGWNNVNVELVSPLKKLRDVNAEPFCVVACVRNEIDMLPMFLAHYRRLGVKGFLLADNCSDDGTLEFLNEQPDVALFSADADYEVTQYGVAWQQALMANLRMDRWSLVADADEFVVLPEGAGSLPDLVGGEDFAGADVGRVFMLDLYPKGPLSEATLASGDPFSELDHCDADPFRNGWTTGPYANADTWTSAVRHRLLEGSRRELFVAQKYALIRYRPWLRFSAGLHYAAEARLAKRDLVFAHFKYHAAFHERARIETQRGQHFNNAEEYRRYLALMAEGRDVLYEEGVSVLWTECAWVKEKLGR